jgi:hypothetical protein
LSDFDILPNPKTKSMTPFRPVMKNCVNNTRRGAGFRNGHIALAPENEIT